MKKRLYIDLLVIFLLSLLPLLWLPDGKLLLGHDAGIPFDPVTHFLDRLSVWSQRIGIGSDQSYGLLGAIFIHGIEAFLIWIGFSIEAQQRIQFIIWLGLPALTMYFMGRKLFPSKKYLPIIASLIYMLNFYLIQAWFVAERPKFSIYAALPLVFYFAVSYILSKMSFKKSVILTGITLGILNAGGSIPLYGGMILVLVTVFTYINLIQFDREILKRTVLYSIGAVSLYVLLNAYWIFSYVYYLFGFYGRDLGLAGGPEGALGWAAYLSKGANFINIFRGQGVPEWYLNPYHAYAENFLSNPILIIASFFFPLAAFAALFLVREKREKFFIYLFALITFIALIFTSGPQSQFGLIFEVMMKYIPGFAIFRSAFYKFGYAFWFSYAILIGFSLDILLSKLEKLKGGVVAGLILVGFIVAYLFYHYPVLNGSFLDYSHEPGKELSTRIRVPQYIFDFGKWVNNQNFIKRFLVVPEVSETGYIAYDWGYWSMAPINSLMAKTSIVQNTFLIPQSERFLMRQMYSALLRRDIKSFMDFADVFAIDSIVVHEDFDWKNKSWGTTDPSTYEKILDSDPNFKLVQIFGRWKVYDIVPRNKSLRVTATNKLSFLHGELNNIASFPYFDPKSPLFMAALDQKNSSYFINEATDVFLGPECIDCELKGVGLGFNYYNPVILPGSFLYPLITYREEQVKKRANDFNSLLNYYLTVSDRRIVEAKWMVDSKQKLNHIQGVLDRYLVSLNDIKTLVEKENWGILGKEENIAAHTIAEHLLQQATLAETIYDNPLLNIEHRGTLGKAYEEVLTLEKLARNREWATKSTVDKKYIFDLPKIDTYGLYVKKGSLSNPLFNTENATISLSENNQMREINPKSTIGDWLYYGDITPGSTKLRMGIKDTTVKNLFESVSPVMPPDPTGISFDNGVYSLTTDSRDKCLSFPIKGVHDQDTLYLVTFKYRNLTDKKDLGFFISKKGEVSPKIRVKEDVLPNNRTWTDFRQPIFVKNIDLNVVFCNGFQTLREVYGQAGPEEQLLPGQTVIQIQDIVLNKVSFPNVVLYLKRKETTQEEFVLDFKKKDTVSYSINTKKTNQPTTLIMRESYGKYWQACRDTKGCLSYDDKAHFASAGFTNGWYLKDGLDGQITLFYFPQRMYEIGAYLTFATIVLLLVGICWNIYQKKLKN